MTEPSAPESALHDASAQQPAASHASPEAHPRRWWVLLAMTGSLSMIFVDMTVVGVSLPSIGGSLGMDVVGQTWIVSAYLLALASLVALGGRMGDLMGKVPAFIAGVAGFAAASVVCGAATDGTMLIAGRVAQGMCAALMQPASSALVISSFAPGERGKAMAVYVGIPMLFLALGPALGGFIVEHAGWRWIFYLNIPVAVAAIGLAVVVRPRDVRSPDRRIDWAGGALLVTGLPLFVYGVQELGAARPHHGQQRIAPSVVAALAVGLALLAIFVRHQWKSPHPLLRLRLFADRALAANALVIACMQFAMTGLVIQGSIYAQEVLGFEPFQAGASLLPLLAPVILVVHIAGRWYDRSGVRPPALWGTSLATVGMLAQSLGMYLQNYPTMAVGMVFMGTGIAFTMSPTNTDALSRVAAEVRGQVSGLVQTLRQVGGTVGVAVTAGAVIFAQSRLQSSAETEPSTEVLASSMAIGGLVASMSTAAAFCIAWALVPRGQRPTGQPAQRPKKKR
ncbi:MAG: MFS transporter [Phycisphaerae bacterium]|nr:MFS transporter [Phycisphaerae bacterium]